MARNLLSLVILFMIASREADMHALCSMAGIRKIRPDDARDTPEAPYSDIAAQGEEPTQALPLAVEPPDTPPSEAVGVKGWWTRVTRSLHLAG